MHWEYLAFDAVVLVPVLVLSLRRSTFFLPRWPAAFTALTLTAIPFLVWDAVVTGRHWWFNEQYVLGPRLGPLPIEEVLFFVAMPFACLFSWRTLFWKPDAAKLPVVAVAPWLVLLPLGIVGAFVGWPEYTSLAIGAVGLAAIVDLALGGGLLRTPRFLAFLVFVLVLTAGFNGYLTGRPIVQYDPRYQLDLRVITTPVEDFIYGLALVIATAAIFERLSRSTGPSRLERFIERRLGGYRHAVVVPDTSQPLKAKEPVKVLVIGGGIAGLSAATVLAERGFSVVLRERNAYLGGKVGAWQETVAGEATTIEHGFHAFFRQYFNLNRLLERVGVSRHFKAIDDYVIIAKDGTRIQFKDVATTPVLNLLSLAHQGIVPWSDLLLNPKVHKLEALLQYDRPHTFAEFDTVSFAEFAEGARLPDRLRLSFNTFARAFFAEEHKMSMAELIRGFHFYYLSNDAGLLYDFLEGDTEKTLLGPFRAWLSGLGATFRLGDPVKRLERTSGGLEVDGETYAHVVLATDVLGAKAILSASKSIEQHAPRLFGQAQALKASQRYAVLRIWIDRPSGEGLPVFVITDRERVLDAVTFNHHFQPEAKQWAAEHRGSVLELHCYAVPDAVKDEEIEPLMLKELGARIPSLAGVAPLKRHLQVRSDFTAFHLGLRANRPGVETELPELVLAGDWVALEQPAMLMEAACVSGVMAANAILRQHGLRAELVESVPPKGLLASVAELRRRRGQRSKG